MNQKRIIPCLDVKDGKVVKGVNFVDLKDIGDVTENAKYYESQGADEIVLLDIAATNENRATMLDVVLSAAKAVSIPISVGGGIKSTADFAAVFGAGARKASINSAAATNKGLIKEASEKFGKERVIVAIDAKMVDGQYKVFINGGRIDTGMDAIEWAKEAESLGAGEILLTSMDTDGTKDGFDIGLTKAVCDAVSIPVIASGGCGKLEDFYDIFTRTSCDAALAASVFHFREVDVKEVKEYLASKGL